MLFMTTYAFRASKASSSLHERMYSQFRDGRVSREGPGDNDGIPILRLPFFDTNTLTYLVYSVGACQWRCSAFCLLRPWYGRWATVCRVLLAICGYIYCPLFTKNLHPHSGFVWNPRNKARIFWQWMPMSIVTLHEPSEKSCSLNRI